MCCKRKSETEKNKRREGETLQRIRIWATRFAHVRLSNKTKSAHIEIRQVQNVNGKWQRRLPSHSVIHSSNCNIRTHTRTHGNIAYITFHSFVFLLVVWWRWLQDCPLTIARRRNVKWHSRNTLTPLHCAVIFPIWFSLLLLSAAYFVFVMRIGRSVSNDRWNVKIVNETK